MLPLGALITRAVRLLRTEGPGSLLRHGVSFGAFLLGRVFKYSRAYLYEYVLTPRDERNFLPRLDSWDVRIIHSNAEADAVAREGMEDIRKVFVYSPRAFDRGGVAFCVYVSGALAHVGWLALTSEAKESIDRLPYHVDFDAGQACTGGTYTIDRFRGKGLMAYGYYLRLEYLRRLGYKSSRNAVAVSNVTSQRVHAKLDPEIRGTGRLIRVLRWSNWKEEPLPGGPVRGLPPTAVR